MGATVAFFATKTPLDLLNRSLDFTLRKGNRKLSEPTYPASRLTTKKIISISLAFISATVFLFVVLNPNGSGFNIIPYVLHEMISRGGAAEDGFVVFFDFLVSFLIYWLIYKIYKVHV